MKRRVLDEAAAALGGKKIRGRLVPAFTQAIHFVIHEHPVAVA
jgi:hypothetical protein